MRGPSNRELWLAFIVIILSTLGYLLVVVSSGGIPAASQLFGHSLGIAGFVMMLMTETLYSLRKRKRGAGWGRMSYWLESHIFTGLVGPYWVLLHSSWKFNGLAGVVMLLTAVVVASGFIGRYIYTAIPRTVDGAVIEIDLLQREVETLGREIQTLASTVSMPLLRRPGSLVGQLRWALGVRWLPPSLRAAGQRLGEAQAQRARLERQAASFAMARRMLSVWHAVHIPIGLVLFSAAFVHIAAAIYYATLLR